MRDVLISLDSTQLLEMLFMGFMGFGYFLKYFELQSLAAKKY